MGSLFLFGPVRLVLVLVTAMVVLEESAVQRGCYSVGGVWRRALYTKSQKVDSLRDLKNQFFTTYYHLEYKWHL